MKLCKHDKYIIINDIWEPKWSTDEILIHTDKIKTDTEHYLIQFVNPSPSRKYGWFYMRGKDIRRSRTQQNGRGTVYVVPMSKRQVFEQIKNCEHQRLELF